jgi:hypothetical protein
MYISQSTLTAIAALLSAEGASGVDTDSIAVALHPLLNVSETVAAEIELQPGEVFLLCDDYRGENAYDECDTLQMVKNEIEARNDDRGDGEDVSSFRLYIARPLEINAQASLNITVRPGRVY